jgi:HSP20 family protein
MPNLVRWDPFADLEQMRRSMDRLFGEFRPSRVASELGTEFGYVPLDIAETDEAYEVEAALPGVTPDEVTVQVHGDTVTIKGEAREETKEEDKNWLRRERRYGAFARAFSLPSDVDADRAVADFKDGVLKLHLPKSETGKPKTIEVRTKGALKDAAS